MHENQIQKYESARIAPMDLLYWKSYLQDRVAEIEPLMTTPWGFICACILIELLARMVNGIGRGKLTRQQFEAFVVEWMDEYSPDAEHPFKFNSPVVRLASSPEPAQPEEKSLATQMYCIMRSSMVHNLSLVAGDSELRSGGADNSIYMTDRKTAQEQGLSHLQNYQNDSAVFVGEDFLDDIGKVIEKVFAAAEADEALKANMAKHLSIRTPVSWMSG
ncbi:hypothetical protein BH11CYA1_BH11CYA1_10510 [soil metagenome]